MYWKRIGYWVLIAVFSAAGVYVESLRRSQPEPEKRVDFSLIPASLSPWVGEDVELDARTIDVLKASEHLMREYVDAETGDRLGLFVAYFASSKEGSQIHSPKHCLPGGGWAILGRENLLLKSPSGLWEANHFLIGKRNSRQAVFYWYLTRRGRTTSEYMLKLNLVLSSLLRQPTDAALVRLTVSGSPDTEAEAVVRKFLLSFGPLIDTALPFSR